LPPAIEAIPVLDTNYVWALHDHEHALLVDPGEADAPLQWLSDRNLQLTAVLITHHHWDHTGGIDGIVGAHPVPVYGSEDGRIPQIDRVVAEGDRVRLAAPAVDFQVLSVPGHTSIHLAFYGHRLLLCGDTLFSAGCGRLFEGTAEQMLESLDQLAALPGDTRVCCAHEYTLDNCRFALNVEPENERLRQRAEEARRLRAARRITLPSTIEQENAINPFLRVREATVITAANQREPGTGDDPAAVFAAIRRWKDST